MKTAISIPDSLFKEAEVLAHRLRVSRSELYANALRAVVEQYDEAAKRRALDELYATESSALAGGGCTGPGPDRLGVGRVKRCEVWWADLGEPVGSDPGYRHPVVVISTDTFNASRISTVIVVMVTSNLRLAAAPGNVRVTARETGLRKESVVNVSSRRRSPPKSCVSFLRMSRLVSIKPGSGLCGWKEGVDLQQVTGSRFRVTVCGVERELMLTPSFHQRYESWSRAMAATILRAAAAARTPDVSSEPFESVQVMKVRCEAAALDCDEAKLVARCSEKSGGSGFGRTVG